MLKKGFLFVLWLVAAAGLHAQKKYIYQDTIEEKVITAPVPEIKEDQVIAAPVEEDVTALAEDESFTDTSLYYRYFYLPEDTVRSWKQMKAFAYAAYLDSLLKNRELEKRRQEERKASSKSKERSSRQSSSSSSSTDATPPAEGFFSSAALGPFFWVLAIIFVLFIIYSLFLKDGAFRRSSKKVVAADMDEEQVEAKPGTDMDSLIAIAVKNRNYRLAVRYQYLKSLHKLAERGFVQYAADKTNYQYVNEISNAALRNSFAGVTLNYEYVWYGEFEIDETIYSKLEAGFAGFNKQI